MDPTRERARKRHAAPFKIGGGRLEVFGRGFSLPRRRRWRVVLGGALVVGGMVGFLPILGFWMIPLGLLVLSADIALVRRWRRNASVRWGRRRHPRKARGSTPAT